jgi:hypothetical protein
MYSGAKALNKIEDHGAEMDWKKGASKPEQSQGLLHSDPEHPTLAKQDKRAQSKIWVGTNQLDDYAILLLFALSDICFEHAFLFIFLEGFDKILSMRRV